MRQFLLATTAVTIASTAAFAADPVIFVDPPMTAVVAQPDRFSGHFEGYLGGLWFRSDEFDESAWLFGGAARANYRFTERFNAQADFFGESTRFDDGPNLDTLGGGLHLYWRNPESYAFGVFGSATSIGSILDLKQYVVGPEAQAYFGNVTLYGQAYYGRLDSDLLEANLDFWGARGVVRYFVHDNFKLEGELGYRKYDVDGDFNQWTLAAQADYRFDNTPFSLFGRYQFDRYSTDYLDVNEHKVLVGFRGTFGADTLKAEDRYGATMNLPSTPGILQLEMGMNP